MNTSELTQRQAELDQLLHDQAYLSRLPMEQSNLLRREKETLDAYLQVQGQTQGITLPEQPAREGIAIAPEAPPARPDAPEVSGQRNVAQEQPQAQQSVKQQQKAAPVRKASVQKKAPKIAAKVISKKKS